MKKILYTVLFLTLLVQGASFKANDIDNQIINDSATEIVKVPFGDPFIMLWEGKYYAYGTYSSDGIAVFISDDLIKWSSTNSLALHKADVWADKSFWAPEVYHVMKSFTCIIQPMNTSVWQPAIVRSAPSNRMFRNQ